jgi:tetratricopeptide (TPR) repeat protein
VYGPDHYELAVTFNNLAALSHAKGDDAEAEQLYRRALAIKQKALGSDHPDVAMTLNNLAVLFKSAGKYSEAEPLYQRALAIFEVALGPTHPKVITCRQNYARLLSEMQRQANAAASKSHAKRARTPRASRSKKE